MTQENEQDKSPFLIFETIWHGSWCDSEIAYGSLKFHVIQVDDKVKFAPLFVLNLFKMINFDNHFDIALQTSQSNFLFFERNMKDLKCVISSCQTAIGVPKQTKIYIKSGSGPKKGCRVS